jgi:hypothetical protein
LITNAVVTLRVSAGNSEETIGGQSVVDCNSDDILTRSELVTIVTSTGATSETSTVDPEVNRTKLLLLGGDSLVWDCVSEVK